MTPKSIGFYSPYDDTVLYLVKIERENYISQYSVNEKKKKSYTSVHTSILGICRGFVIRGSFTVKQHCSPFLPIISSHMNEPSSFISLHSDIRNSLKMGLYIRRFKWGHTVTSRICRTHHCSTMEIVFYDSCTSLYKNFIPAHLHTW